MLYYEITPCDTSTDWVVLIHGAGGSMATWAGQVRPFSRYYNVLCVDLQGHGCSQSDLPAPQMYTLKMAADQVIEVLDYLEIDQANFVSMSLGSNVSSGIVQFYPERVKTTLFAGGVACVHGFWRLLFDISRWIGAHARFLFPRHPIYILLSWAIIPSPASKVSRKLYQHEGEKVSYDQFWAWVETTSFGMQDENVQAFIDAMNKLNKPVLFVTGEKDSICRKGIEALVPQINNARLEISPKSGHVCSIDRGWVFNRLALAFLAENNLESVAAAKAAKEKRDIARAAERTLREV